MTVGGMAIKAVRINDTLRGRAEGNLQKLLRNTSPTD